MSFTPLLIRKCFQSISNAELEKVKLIPQTSFGDHERLPYSLHSHQHHPPIPITPPFPQILIKKVDPQADPPAVFYKGLVDMGGIPNESVSPSPPKEKRKEKKTSENADFRRVQKNIPSEIVRLRSNDFEHVYINWFGGRFFDNGSKSSSGLVV